MTTEPRTRDIEWLRADYERQTGSPFRTFYCPMLMRDELPEPILGHVVPEKFEGVPEYKIIQRPDIDNWYGSMFEADFLTLTRHQGENIHDLFFGGKPARGLKPKIVAGGEDISYYILKDDPEDMPINEHTLMEINGKNGGFLRLALKKSPEEVQALQHVKWHSEVFGDFRVAALVSIIKAAYLTLFWKLGYQYTLSSAGLSVGREILGRFFLDNYGKPTQQVRLAATQFFRPYINMLRPAEVVGENAPRGTIEDNRVFVWLGSSGQGVGIGVFVRTDERLQCVLMPGYSGPEAAAVYHDFLTNEKHELWVREGQFNEAKGCWEVHPQRVPILWPKLHESFDLSRSPEEILKDRFRSNERLEDESIAQPPSENE
jgi:hypothetical protein